MSLGTIRCILHTHETGADVVDAVYWALDVLRSQPENQVECNLLL